MYSRIPYSINLPKQTIQSSESSSSSESLSVTNGITGTTITASGEMNANSLSVTNGIAAKDITTTGLIQGLNLLASANITATGSNSILSVASGNDTTHTLGMASIGNLGFNDDSTGIKHKDQPLSSYALLQGADGTIYSSSGIGKTHIFKTAHNASGNTEWMVGSNAGVTVYTEFKVINTNGDGVTHFNIPNNTRNNYVRGTTEFSQHAYFPAGSTSDDRLKHNEVYITNGLSVISQLTPKKYDKTAEMFSENYTGDISGDYIVEAGFIAQEVLETDISFVVKVPDNIETTPYGIDYNCLFTYAVAGIKELDAIVTTQASTISTLEAKLATQEAKLSALEARLKLAGI